MMTADSEETRMRHMPVLRDEATGLLAPRESGIYVDGTFGAGGYARAILSVPGTRVIGIDRDPDAIAAGREMEKAFPDRLTLLQGRFSRMEELLRDIGIASVDGVVLDLGVSSMQLDDPQRGFSFLRDGPLDMRMERQGMSAADVVNAATERELADILWLYGEERRSRAIARAIVRSRKAAPIRTTAELASIVENVLGPKRHPGQAHPATRTFQALRIHVNGELREVAEGLAAAERILKPGGRLSVVSFHSLEDRIVKRFLAIRTGRAGRPSRHLPDVPRPEPSFIDLAPGGIRPSEAEVAANPRARSARLRGGERTHAPAIPLDFRALGMPEPHGGGR